MRFSGRPFAGNDRRGRRRNAQGGGRNWISKRRPSSATCWKICGARRNRRGVLRATVFRARSIRSRDVKALADALQLNRLPAVMECFDISNISTTHVVASMVCFRNGVPDKDNYRRYRIRTVAGQDDFASMAEVVRRRYSRVLLEAARNQIPTRRNSRRKSQLKGCSRLEKRTLDVQPPEPRPDPLSPCACPI